jgi:glutathione S-transferase
VHLECRRARVRGQRGKRVGVTIYGSIGSRASRCIWVAEEIGLQFDWQPISTLDGSSRSPAYLAINPSGKIPALRDGDLVLTESFAINQYLAERYGGGILWPDDPAERARVHQWTFWSATEIEPFVTELFPQFVRLTPAQRDQPLVDRLVASLFGRLAFLEQALAGRPYVRGGFSLADINLAVQTFTFVDRFALDLSSLPAIDAWTRRCKARPARQKVEQRVKDAAPVAHRAP